MKCPDCGTRYFSSTACPHCGREPLARPSRLAEFLSRTFEMGPYQFTYFYLYVLLAVNVSLIAAATNGILFGVCHMDLLWFHYIFGALALLFLLFRASFSPRNKGLAFLRRIFFVVFVTFSVTELAASSPRSFVFLQYVFPALLITQGILCYLFLFLKRSTQASFLLTLSWNAALSLVCLLFMYLLTFDTAGGTLTILAAAFSLLLFANAALLKLFSAVFRFRRGAS